MALHEMNYEFVVENPTAIKKEWVHVGVVGSGDLEVLIEQKDYQGAVKVKIVTPVTGFDFIWKKILENFIDDHQLGNLLIEINDNNATPIVVSMRLAQALAEVNRGDKEGE